MVSVDPLPVLRSRMRTEPTGQTLGALAEAAERRDGDRCTLLFEGAEQTATQLAAQARRLAGGLTGLGVRAGDRVAVCMANCPEVLITYQAAWRLGAAVTPLMFLLSEDELRHALTDSGAVAVVVTAEFLPKARAAAAGVDVRLIAVGAGDATDGVLVFADLCGADEAPLAVVDPTSMAALLYTGGTTGRSKGVMLSHDALSVAAWSATASTAETDLSTSILPLPLAHAYGLLVACLQLHAVRPWRVVLMRWFDPAGWLRLVEQQRVQTGGVVPTMLRLMADQPLEDHDLSSLQRLVSGSAPLPAEVREQWARRVPHLEIVEGYGCSETAALASSTRVGAGRDGSVGTAAPLVELRIEPLGSGSDSGGGDGGGGDGGGGDGEVCIRTPSLMTGYWHDPAATAATVRDGWFHTGDVGHLDADGYLFIVDRLKDVIIRGGFNVYPRDVEEALIRHPEVAVCAVVGRPDSRQGEEVVAFVQLHPGATVTEADLVAYARQHLSALKYPREVHVVDAVPLTSVGKLDRKRLRAQL